MSYTDIKTLALKFEDGDIPTETDFYDLINSSHNRYLNPAGLPDTTTFNEGQCTFTFTSGIAEITDNSATGALFVPWKPFPCSIGNLADVYGSSAFYYNTNITSLDIPPNVTSIGSYAFCYCVNLIGDLVIPDSVTTIGSGAFYMEYGGNSGFDGTLTIGNSVTTIGSSAFWWHNRLTGDLVIPDSVTSLGSFAFYQCSGFNGSLTIGSGLTTIENGVFSYCSGLTGTLTIGNSVTSIGNYVFTDCSGLTGSLTIPDSVTSIGDGAFVSCSGFTSLTIPDSVTSIGGYAFRNCSNLSGSLTILDSVTTIGSSAFRDCSGLTNVDCYVTKTIFDQTNVLLDSGVTTLHARASDVTWTAGAGQTIGGKTGIEVFKDL